MPVARPHLLPAVPDLSASIRFRLRTDHDRFARDGLPDDLPRYLRDAYDLDIAGSYGGQPIASPWGKGSGQLSMTLPQVAEAADAGLGFVVLKTVIAEDARGHRTMGAWAVAESRMVPEPIVGASGAEGWTISWKGRGWWQSFASYLDLLRDSTALGRDRGLVVAASVKYHLPTAAETSWDEEEYRATTLRLLDAHTDAVGNDLPLLLEADFSPTLAGSDRAEAKGTILRWLETLPALVRGAAGSRKVVLGLKLFNALFEDEFQVELLRAVHEAERPDFLVYANRLFDPDRAFDGARGIAVGGPDLSDRNLRTLSVFRDRPRPGPPLEVSATGDVASGRIAVEYALRGCSSFQIHTGFQLPSHAYPMRRGTKVERALHLLNFHPEDGLVAWLLHASRRLGLEPRLAEVARVGATSSPGDLHAQLA